MDKKDWIEAYEMLNDYYSDFKIHYEKIKELKNGNEREVIDKNCQRVMFKAETMLMANSELRQLVADKSINTNKNIEGQLRLRELMTDPHNFNSVMKKLLPAMKSKIDSL